MAGIICCSTLVASGLSKKTISQHVGNADFYINDYLLHYEGESAREGITSINSFFGYYFIRKCAWSTPYSIRQYATSLKKFYKFLLGEGVIEAEDYYLLLDTIKSRMDDWVYDCACYNDEDFEWGW